VGVNRRDPLYRHPGPQPHLLSDVWIVKGVFAYWIWYRLDISRFERTDEIPVRVDRIVLFEEGGMRVWMTPLNGMNPVAHEDPFLEPMTPLEAIAWSATGGVEEGPKEAL